MAAPSSRKTSRWPVIVVITFLVVFSVVFVIALALTTESEMAVDPIDASQLNADSYLEQVSPLLKDADATQGATLVEKYGCIACHRGEAVLKIAPPFEGIAEHAITRRPPLTAAAYIYEAITNPTAYVIPEYNPVMPVNYAEQLSERELGDIIAYLLTADAH